MPTVAAGSPGQGREPGAPNLSPSVGGKNSSAWAMSAAMPSALAESWF